MKRYKSTNKEGGLSLASVGRVDGGLSWLLNREAYYAFASGVLVFVFAFVVSAMINVPGISLAEEQIHADVTSEPYSVSIASVDGDTVLIEADAVGTGVEATGKDTVKVTTNAPMYRLYIQTTTENGRLVNSEAGSWISPSAGDSVDGLAALTGNTWGYGIHKDATTGVGKGTVFPTTATYTTGETYNIGSTQYAKVATTSPGDLIWDSDSSAPSGATMEVFYTVNVNTSLAEGTYLGTIKYTAIADSGTGDSGVLEQVSPARVTTNQSNVALTINTSMVVSDPLEELGNISATVGGVNLSNCSGSVAATGKLTVSCVLTSPSAVTVGANDVVVDVEKYGREIVGQNAIRIEEPTLTDVNTLQEITPAICARSDSGLYSGTGNAGSSTIAEWIANETKHGFLDTRGYGNAGGTTDHRYAVVKAADGNCWMAENLRLYNKAITATDSDVTSNFTIPASSTWNTNNYTSALMHVADGTGQYADKNNTYGTYGEAYYNWCAATAQTSCGGTSVATTSICPKNWKLPLNGDKNTNYSYAKLLDSYSLTTGAAIIAKTELGFARYYGYWDWNLASEAGQGSCSYFWSATPSSADYAYRMYYNSSAVYPQDISNKGYGFSVRCVVR